MRQEKKDEVRKMDGAIFTTLIISGISMIISPENPLNV
jgi:hypothetical protein